VEEEPERFVAESILDVLVVVQNQYELAPHEAQVV
jgi:hypothetical protein